MIDSAQMITWHTANQSYLVAALAGVRAALEARQKGGAVPDVPPISAETFANLPAPPALETLCATFDLSPFERAILLLCAGVELDSTMVTLYAGGQSDTGRVAPTFGLALAVLPQPHWSALLPNAPLRRWRLIEVGAGDTLTTSPLRIDERVLHYLAGLSHLDERLVGLIDPVRVATDLIPSHQELTQRVAAAWGSPGAGDRASVLPVIELCGDESVDKSTIASAACAALGLNLYRLSATHIPPNPVECDTLLRLWAREAALSVSALLLDCSDVDHADPAQARALAYFSDHNGGLMLIATTERQRHLRRLSVTFTVNRPTSTEQRQLWQSTLGSATACLNGQINGLVSQFNLGAPAISAVGAAVLNRAASADELAHEAFGQIVWDVCRVQARARLDDLAQRIESDVEWDDLVLPDVQRNILREISAHVRQRSTVYDSWGFAARGARGLGISALFAGPSGTGKTLAAEVLAHTLRLDLYRIDLSSVVSKYIGETEKNLRRVFDAAEESGAILLFDEADALFGRRSEVKDSHDRYANIEVSYLLQRMESYRGLAILTTNLKSAIDTAFLRRIRFVVQFPFPDAAHRAEIWRRIFPASTPTRDLDVTKLARLNVAGGNIRNIALNAAFLAADAGQSVTMAHLMRAASSEYAKLEKPITDAEIGGWL